jgi:hypothetical protein
MQRAWLVALFLEAISLPAFAQAPAGSEFQVNTYVTNAQRYPAVALDASGNFVVVWQSALGQDGGNDGVFGQRFLASGVRQGSEFRVNTYTTSFQSRPSVASDPSGNFVAVWQSLAQDGSIGGIFGQRFSASGVPQGPEFIVNSFTTGDQYQASVAAAGNGDFVVVWTSLGQDYGDYLGGVFGQRFDASGVRQGNEFQVNSYTTGVQDLPAVAADPSGSFVVVWRSFGQDGSSSGIFGQRFDASGVPNGSEFPVNSSTTGGQLDPAVSTDASGNFVVVWEDYFQEGSSAGIFARRFDAFGAPQGPEFLVNTYTTNKQLRPSVASDEDGRFVVVWTSFTQDDGDYGSGIFGQHFNASGVRQGGEFRVNSFTVGYQTLGRVASSPDGDFVVVWSSNLQDGSSYGVFGQRYGDLIFEDGFESGDLSRWSSASTGGFDLSVGGAAAMGGTSAGLQAFVNDTGSLFVQDDTPDAEDRYRARFYFDPNGFDPGETGGHFRTRIFIAFDDSSTRLITLVLKRQTGAYSVEARVRLNDGSRADTGFFPITDGPHFLEFDWIRSSAPGASDGYFTLRIDGTAVSVLTLLNDDARAVGFVRMGAIAIKTGATGTLLFDQFESRRHVFIGPE